MIKLLIFNLMESKDFLCINVLVLQSQCPLYSIKE